MERACPGHRPRERGRRLRRGFAVAVVALAAALAGCDEPPDGSYPGLLEADMTDLGAEVSGRLVTLSVREGQVVASGQALFSLDAGQAEAVLAEAQARATEAEARLADLQAQVQRPADVAVLEAALDRARTALDLSRRDLARVRPLADSGVSPQARLDEAEAAFARDRAALTEAERRVEAARTPARAAQIQAAAAALEAARAAVRAAADHVDDYRVAAPVSGRVERLLADVGEVVPVGRAVLSLQAEGALHVRFLVPEARRSAVSIGQRVGVSCDSCPAGLEADITFIAADAEFTAPMMLARGQRHRLAYRVEARPLGALAGLPAGQPVTVHLPEDGHGG